MNPKVSFNAIFSPSENIVARLIEDELVIVPLTSGVGDMEDELYTLNESGRAVWEKLDGKTSLRDVVAALARDYDGPGEEIEQDVMGLIEELLKRKIIVETVPR